MVWSDKARKAAAAARKRKAKSKTKPFSPFSDAGMHLYLDTGKKADAARIAHFKETMGILQAVQRRQGKKVSRMPRKIRKK